MMYLEKFRDLEVLLQKIKEEEFGPTSYGRITHYACGGKTSIKTAEMKQDITIENKEGQELSVDE